MEGSSRRTLSSETSRGTSCYRAPELLLDDNPHYTNKVDIWAVGCILYELILRKRAFQYDWSIFKYAESGKEFELLLTTQVVPDDRKREFLAKIMKELLDVDPKKRPKARDLYERLISWGLDGVFTINRTGTDVSEVATVMDQPRVPEAAVPSGGLLPPYVFATDAAQPDANQSQELLKTDNPLLPPEKGKPDGAHVDGHPPPVLSTANRRLLSSLSRDAAGLRHNPGGVDRPIESTNTLISDSTSKLSQYPQARSEQRTFPSLQATEQFTTIHPSISYDDFLEGRGPSSLAAPLPSPPEPSSSTYSLGTVDRAPGHQPQPSTCYDDAYNDDSGLVDRNTQRSQQSVGESGGGIGVDNPSTLLALDSSDGKVSHSIEESISVPSRSSRTAKQAGNQTEVVLGESGEVFSALDEISEREDGWTRDEEAAPRVTRVLDTVENLTEHFRSGWQTEEEIAHSRPTGPPDIPYVSSTTVGDGGKAKANDYHPINPESRNFNSPNDPVPSQNQSLWRPEFAPGGNSSENEKGGTAEDSKNLPTPQPASDPPPIPANKPLVRGSPRALGFGEPQNPLHPQISTARDMHETLPQDVRLSFGRYKLIRIVPAGIDSFSGRTVLFDPIQRNVNDGEVLMVGRHTDNFVAEHPTGIIFRSRVVSRVHAMIWLTNGQWFLQDVGSSSGTFLTRTDLNHVRLSEPNERSAPCAIEDGDIVQLGTNHKVCAIHCKCADLCFREAPKKFTDA
jgi:Protein kinase domain/FHA domain